VTLALIALGAFHGANPAMGWLFATALGMQERRAWGVVRALPPIALGHAAAVATVLLGAGALSLVIPLAALRIVAACVLFAFAGYKIATRWRHPTWVGMRVTTRDLIAWSFLMASAHGAGLMLLPIVLHQPVVAASMPGMVGASFLGLPSAAVASMIALHTAALFSVMAVMALGAYTIFGVGGLRRAWLNLDYIWGGALLVAGVVTLAM
jgi:hypothetical protein